jgi:hypothetical protein
LSGLFGSRFAAAAKRPYQGAKIPVGVIGVILDSSPGSALNLHCLSGAKIAGVSPRLIPVAFTVFYSIGARRQRRSISSVDEELENQPFTV